MLQMMARTLVKVRNTVSDDQCSLIVFLRGNVKGFQRSDYCFFFLCCSIIVLGDSGGPLILSIGAGIDLLVGVVSW